MGREDRLTVVTFIDKIDEDYVQIKPMPGGSGDYPKTNSIEVKKGGVTILLAEEDWDRVFAYIAAIKATR